MPRDGDQRRKGGPADRDRGYDTTRDAAPTPPEPIEALRARELEVAEKRVGASANGAIGRTEAVEEVASESGGAV